MKKATKRKIILSGILFNMILVFIACGLCNKPAFVGNESEKNLPLYGIGPVIVF